MFSWKNFGIILSLQCSKVDSTVHAVQHIVKATVNLYFTARKPVKGIVSRDFGTLFLFYWIVLKVLIGPEQVYFSF
jgi:hypothetical protein